MLDILLEALVYHTIFNVCYYVSSLFAFVLDYFGLMDNNKIQNDTNTMFYYKKCIGCVMRNTLLAPILPSLLFAYYGSTYVDDFCIYKCISDIFVSVILVDILLYSLHRILHIPYLYKLFHKKHHEIVAPVGFSAVYMTLTDLYIGNALPVYLPMYIVGAHPTTIKIWLIITIVNTIFISHSGFDILDFHDKHHSLFNKNYGIDIFMDRLFGTHSSQVLTE